MVVVYDAHYIMFQAMAIVYGRCFEEIGPFNDTAFMVHKLEEVCVRVCVCVVCGQLKVRDVRTCI